MDEQDFRIEHDTMGEVRVPAAALYRAQTQRAVENFPVSGRGLERAQIRALGLLKAAAARVNGQLGILEPGLAEAIATAADEVAEGRHDEHFPIDVFQTGSGTSSNMNANEVVATLASRALGQDVHPNDHVNASQSSNDTFPTTIRVAATEAVLTEVIPALEHLATTVESRAAEWGEVVKSGRTHLMDAVPMTLAQEAGAWASQMRYGVERLRSGLDRLGELPIGGTAIGSGLNAPAGFGTKVAAELASVTGLPLTEARDHFEAQATQDGVVETSGHFKTVAVSLNKIANDLRWLGSGPRTGLAELALPDLQPGSSIMPGKVNPVIPEATLQVVAQVVGNDAAVSFAGAQGNFQLNVNLPVIARNVLESARLLGGVSRLLADKVFAGLEVDAARAREYAEGSPSIVTPLNRYIGYEEAAAVAKQALKERRPIREVVLERGHVDNGTLTVEQLDTALDVLAMAHPPA
ncbi:aspartate ammonia-lyase [Allosaccharopolyspora coralli]|uniref:Fumarate hydratase class II n=1 Tax=Allosaccharopolyspora coralli TaxID=2665642 RepID=A0A5Q3Q383_9PSEU|nr:class II fumarate hydratase [Allosaccharopolyspora coralli]QGK68803.1 aspartate ammonia-lyase [Allosaccharopolyspora coralli]